MYCVIGAPPLYEGSVHETVACALAPVADTLVGIPGWVTEIIGFDESEAGPLPALLVAVTVNLYWVP